MTRLIVLIITAIKALFSRRPAIPGPKVGDWRIVHVVEQWDEFSGESKMVEWWNVEAWSGFKWSVIATGMPSLEDAFNEGSRKAARINRVNHAVWTSTALALALALTACGTAPDPTPTEPPTCPEYGFQMAVGQTIDLHFSEPVQVYILGGTGDVQGQGTADVSITVLDSDDSTPRVSGGPGPDGIVRHELAAEVRACAGIRNVYGTLQEVSAQ